MQKRPLIATFSTKYVKVGHAVEAEQRSKELIVSFPFPFLSNGVPGPICVNNPKRVF